MVVIAGCEWKADAHLVRLVDRSRAVVVSSDWMKASIEAGELQRTDTYSLQPLIGGWGRGQPTANAWEHVGAAGSATAAANCQRQAT